MCGMIPYLTSSFDKLNLNIHFEKNMHMYFSWIIERFANSMFIL